MPVTMREAWTDERLDDFKAHVDQRFDAVDRRFDEVDRRFDRVEGDIRELRVEVRDLRVEMAARFDSLQRTMVLGFVGMSASIFGALLVVPH